MDFTAITTGFAQATRLRGVVATVARRLGLSHEHVRQVALGNRVSRRVQIALRAELRRRDRNLLRERAA